MVSFCSRTLADIIELVLLAYDAMDPPLNILSYRLDSDNLDTLDEAIWLRLFASSLRELLRSSDLIIALFLAASTVV